MSSLKTKILTLTTAAILTAGALLAAVPHNNHMNNHLQKMAAQLGLTDAQQAQAKAIFQGARQTAKPVRQQLRLPTRNWANREVLPWIEQATSISPTPATIKLIG